MGSFEDYRPRLFGIAYRMLGSAMEAEDIVQEAFLRYQATPAEEIRSPQAYLSTIVTRLCLDQLKSARMTREEYIGPWLPEPIFTAEASQRAIEMESISMAFLVLLENLTPTERAVFLLREVFDYDYSEIATIIQKEEAACRQLFSRAKKHIHANKPRFDPSPEKHQAILGRFLTACTQGDLNSLTDLLLEDVVAYSDGGGKIAAAIRPVIGRDKVMRFILGLFKRAPEGMQYAVKPVNGMPALIIYWPDGKLFNVVNLDVEEGRIRAIRQVLNPDKLRHL